MLNTKETPMSDDDMIRRGDAVELAQAKGLLSVEELRALPAVQVGVKPLEWFEGDEPDEWRAGPYDVWCELGKFQVYQWSIVLGEPHETAEAAKAAAQADYDARIRSALTVQPSPDVAALIEACDAMVNNEDWGTITYTDGQMWVDADNVRAALAAMKEGK